MQLTRDEIIIASAATTVAAVIGGVIGYFSKKRNAPPSKRSVTKAATPVEPVVLSEEQQEAQMEFDKAYVAIARDIEFDRNWYSSNGRMGGLVHSGIAQPGVYRSKDADGRRVIIQVTSAGTANAAYTRWIGDRSHIETISTIDGKTETRSVKGILAAVLFAATPVPPVDVEKTVNP